MIVTRQLNIRAKQGHFFTNIININDFDPGLLHVNKRASDYDLVAYDIKYVKNLNRIDQIFDEIDEQIESMSDDKAKYYRDIMKIKFKTIDELVFNEIINILVCNSCKKCF